MPSLGTAVLYSCRGGRWGELPGILPCPPLHCEVGVWGLAWSWVPSVLGSWDRLWTGTSRSLCPVPGSSAPEVDDGRWAAGLPPGWPLSLCHCPALVFLLRLHHLGWAGLDSAQQVWAEGKRVRGRAGSPRGALCPGGVLGSNEAGGATQC